MTTLGGKTKQRAASGVAARATSGASESAVAQRQRAPLSEPQRPTLARTEVVDRAVRQRFEEALEAALKSKAAPRAKAVQAAPARVMSDEAGADGAEARAADASETLLAGALRALGGVSRELRAVLAEATATVQRRGSRERPLYVAGLRTLAESGDKQATPLLKVALAADDGGGLLAASAASFSREPALAALLGKLAAHRQSHVAFGAEVARVARGDSNGAHLASLAPRIKESHRIALCAELIVPLARGSALPIGVAPALSVLRGAERHLGRWLPMAEIATRAGDSGPLVEAETRSSAGPESARAAWSLVAWSLREISAPAAVAIPLPATRPTGELVARLSDRPSADRDMTFLFRLARARVPAARAMLESLARTTLDSEAPVRAAMYLARDHGREDLRRALEGVASSDSFPSLRGLACAALWDAGERERARAIAEELSTSPIIGNVAWSARVRAAAKSPRAISGELASETWVRWIQRGWLD